MTLINQNSYPILSFPPRIYGAAMEVVNIVQVTHVIAFSSCLSALSIAVGPNADWQHPATGQIRPSTLNLAIAAASGDRKSSADELVCRPIYAHDAAAIVSDREDAKEYKKALTRWAAVRKGLLSRLSRIAGSGESTDDVEAALHAHEALEPVPPTEHRIIHHSMTHAAAFEALQGDGKAIALLTDEGHTLLESTIMRHYGFLNHAWDGKALLTHDRARDESIVAQNPRVTVSFMVQPEVLHEYIRKRGRTVHASGFWARYLFARSPSLMGYRQATLSTPALAELLPFHSRISELLEAYQEKLKTGNVTREVLTFDDNAKQLWRQIASNVEANLVPGYFLSDISDFGNKYMDMVGRIACLLWYFESDLGAPAGGGLHAGQIPAAVLNQASVIADWHLQEYKQIFAPGPIRSPEDIDADSLAAYLYRICFNRNPPVVAKNLVRRHCGLRGAGRFDAALDLLQRRQAVFLSAETQAGARKPTEQITLNPPYFVNFPVH